MKKLLCLIGILIFAASAVQPAFASAPAAPQIDEPPPTAWPEAKTAVFLPVVNTAARNFYTVTGQVKGANDQPLSGVTISSDTGQSTLTDASGVYSLKVPEGERYVAATMEGKYFDPAPAWLDMKANHNNVNFSAGAACYNPTPNPSFETVFYWNPISGSAAGYTPFYTSARANTGLWSGYTGIPVGWANVQSWSRWRSHEIYIPADATSATVSLAIFPLTQEAWLSKGDDGKGLSAADAPDLSGMNTDDPQAPDAGDGQYLIVTDVFNNYLGTLIWARRNDGIWLGSGPQSLLAWRGRWVKLEFGTYNDGWGGVTSAYFDDVVVNVCRGAVVTCTTPTNILLNSNFEADAGWNISPANYPSLYTTDFFYSATRSMFSGRAIGSAPLGIWTTGEFYQYVTVPITATSAILKVRLLPRSTDGWGYNILKQQALDEEVAAKGINAPLAAESQYGYLCAYGYCGPNPYTIGQLFRWFPLDSAYWLYREFDLTGLRGSSFGIVFGAQNDGDWNNTALYVDDAVLEICTP